MSPCAAFRQWHIVLSLSCSTFFGALLTSTAIRVSPKLAGLVRLFNGKAARGERLQDCLRRAQSARAATRLASPQKLQILAPMPLKSSQRFLILQAARPRRHLALNSRRMVVRALPGDRHVVDVAFAE